MKFNQIKWSFFTSNISFSYLGSEWKKLASPTFLKEDIVAGLTVACIGIPLALAIALASSVPPEAGLVTAIVGGLVCTLLGGSTFVMSGPTPSMVVLVASIVQVYGMNELFFVLMGSGLLQLLSGFFGLGRLIRLIPIPVVSGFTAGMGAIILIGQLPRAMGLPAPDQQHTIYVITHIGNYLHHTQASALLLAVGTLFCTQWIPRISSRIPASLAAVVVMTLFSYIFDTPIQRIGALPRSLPMPSLPYWPKDHHWFLIQASFAFYLLASLETLLSATAVDKIIKGPKHNPNQELFGQGLGNLVSGLLGGLPITGAITRSTVNIQAGAKTRRSGVVQALVLIAVVLIFAPLIERIPIPVLAGILVSVALRMLGPKEFFYLWRVSRSEAVVYLITFVSIVFIDLVAGVQAGILSALAILAFRLSQMGSHFYESTSLGPNRFSLSGSVTFMSSEKISVIRQQIESLKPSQGVSIDMSRVIMIDASGAEQLLDLAEAIVQHGNKLALQGLSAAQQKLLIACDSKGTISKTFAVTESDVKKLLDSQQGTPIDRLVFGVERFRKDSRSHYQPLFDRLAEMQNPHTLFITCSDSRVSPNLITSTDPGELFVVRNVGNIIPEHVEKNSSETGADPTPAEGAAIEFAVEVLGITEIVVCGHSGCGAMKAIISGAALSTQTDLGRWLTNSSGMKPYAQSCATAEDAARKNALVQLNHLMTYPVVREKVEKNEIRIHAWFYDIGVGEIEVWDAQQQKFVTLGNSIAYPKLMANP